MRKQDRSHLNVKVDDRVRYIGDGAVIDPEHYPPVDTWGTVVDVNETSHTVKVQWDEGTMPGAWWADETDIALLTYKDKKEGKK